jgi:hypothetical protein
MTIAIIAFLIAYAVGMSIHYARTRKQVQALEEHLERFEDALNKENLDC